MSTENSTTLDNESDLPFLCDQSSDIDPYVGFKVPPIEESFKLEPYQTVSERYCTPRFLPAASGVAGEDHCVMFHSNKICIICLAPRHPVLAHSKTVTRVDFQVTAKLDRSKNTVSGKAKHGAQFLQPNSPLCFIDCADGSRYTIYSCVQGKLVEVNDGLVSNPDLLVQRPTAEGYIAIVLPNINSSNKFRDKLLSSEEYVKLQDSEACSAAVDSISDPGTAL